MKRAVFACIAFMAVVLMGAACGGGSASKKASPTSAASTTSVSVSETSSTVESATSPSTLGGAAAETCVNQDPATAVPPIPKLTDPTTAAHAGYGFTVDYPSSWYDGTDQSTVTAGGLLDPTTLSEAGVKPTDKLSNLNVANKSNYPALTVYRFEKVNDTLDAVAGRMAAALKNTGAQTSPLRSWCLDGAPARGFLALSASGSLQESWFALHGDSLYYAFFIGKTDGTQATQDEQVKQFAAVLVTWKWS